MNDDHKTHPQEGDLLLYLDGELAAKQSESIRGHLDACWTCRMHAAGIQAAIVEYARLRENSVLPDPPRPWKDLTPEFLQAEESADHRPAWKRRVGFFFAAAGALAAATWFVLPKQPVAEPKTFPKPTVIERTTLSPASKSVVSKVIPLKSESVTLVPGAHEELAVIAALHRVEADLGEPVDLVRSPDRTWLTLNAFGLTPDRKETIREAMGAFPWLRLHFQEPSKEGGPTRKEAQLSPARRPIAFEEKLLQHLGSRRGLEQFTNSVLDVSDQILTRSHALHKLEERFHDATGLDSGDQAVLGSIRGDHQRVLSQAANELQRSLEPVFRLLTIEVRAAPHTPLLETSRCIDQLVNAALAGAQSDLTDHDLYAELKGYVFHLLELIAA
jgi:hypothetical protein